jgi:hypothetical protein
MVLTAADRRGKMEQLILQLDETASNEAAISFYYGRRVRRHVSDDGGEAGKW